MSMRISVSCKCPVCRAEFRRNVLASTSTFGSPDLDLRPAPMQRSTMHLWLQECPECGYVDARMEEPAGIDAAFLESAAYLICDGLRFKDDLAVRFYRYYLLCRERKDARKAFQAALHAAWVCDDRADREHAIHCRKLALAELEMLLADAKDRETLLVQRADILRRAGLFDQLLAEYGDLSFPQEQLNRIIAFHLEKAAQRDDGCYTLECTKK